MRTKGGEERQEGGRGGRGGRGKEVEVLEEEEIMEAASKKIENEVEGKKGGNEVGEKDCVGEKEQNRILMKKGKAGTDECVQGLSRDIQKCVVIVW